MSLFLLPLLQLLLLLLLPLVKRSIVFWIWNKKKKSEVCGYCERKEKKKKKKGLKLKHGVLWNLVILLGNGSYYLKNVDV